VAYDDLVRVWREADAIPQIEHAWLYDHLMPIFGDPDGPAFEGWTLLAAMAAQTGRLRLGLLVTSNRFRPPAMLAKIAAGVDVISGGRLEFGIGAGSNLTVPIARREYAAHGLPFHDADFAVGSLAESCAIITRLWAESAPFDFDGSYHQLTGAYCNPKPVQRPRPPVTIGGRSTPTLRVVARYADRWNMPGGSIGDAIARSAALDRLCAEIGRDPAEITRSAQVVFTAQEPPPGSSSRFPGPAGTRELLAGLIAAGARHLVLGPIGAPSLQWVADEIIRPVLSTAGSHG
jgi:alkanesulfonate monooxygenase SsuD/methylene tetrahydromethanopterin reductase-like flavin-dependent oxidoreductase (luciferase family)